MRSSSISDALPFVNTSSEEDATDARKVVRGRSLQQQSVDDAEGHGVDAHADGQREDSGGGKSRTRQQLPPRETQVLSQRVHRRWDVRVRVDVPRRLERLLGGVSRWPVSSSRGWPAHGHRGEGLPMGQPGVRLTGASSRSALSNCLLFVRRTGAGGSEVRR